MSDMLRVGAIPGSTGATSPFTGDITSAQRVTDAHGRYFDAVRCGGVFGVSARNLTLAAGQGYAQAANATANFIFWNPLNSGKLASLLKFSFATLSGTPAAGEVNYQISGSNLITSVANGTHVNLGTGSISGSAMRSWVKTAAAALAGTAAFNDVRPAFSQSAFAVSATTSVGLATDVLDGEFLLAPGMAWTFGVGGAGTTWVASVGLVWEELPYLV